MMKIGVYSNVTQEGICRKLGRVFEDIKKPTGYGNWYLPLLNNDIEEDIIFIILDGLELFRNIEDVEKELSNYINIIEKAVKDNSDKKFFLSTIDVHEDSIHAIKYFNIKDKEIENNRLKHL